ncbi:glycosyltransferase family 4 protein [Aquihabitans daechungensis]|uniref:glycosyltransferase family 4 protein n=1 Tax=Aquihabitans daechungensis TaxID=1052257 RepID=UPI003BA1F7B3
MKEVLDLSLGFIGIHAGRRKSQPVSQNETLANLFERDGYVVHRSSAVKRPALRTLHHLWSLIAWRDVDVVVVAVFSGPSFLIAEYATLMAKVFHHPRVVLFLHGGKLAEWEESHPRRVRRAFRRADLIFAPSEFLAASFRERGYDVGIIPNVLALDRYTYTPRAAARPRLLWMRTFQDVYDPKTAVAVLARVAERHPDVTMTMGGADHGALAETQQLAADLGVADRIDFAGYLDAATKARAFADHDVYLNTNLADNMPVSLIEAAASGLVPVATAVGGIPALVEDGTDALLAPAGDVEALSAAVCRLLDDPAVFEPLSRGARALAERSGWASVRQGWEHAFAELDIPRKPR